MKHTNLDIGNIRKMAGEQVVGIRIKRVVTKVFMWDDAIPLLRQNILEMTYRGDQARCLVMNNITAKEIGKWGDGKVPDVLIVTAEDLPDDVIVAFWTIGKGRPRKV